MKIEVAEPKSNVITGDKLKNAPAGFYRKNDGDTIILIGTSDGMYKTEPVFFGMSRIEKAAEHHFSSCNYYTRIPSENIKFSD